MTASQSKSSSLGTDALAQFRSVTLRLHLSEIKGVALSNFSKFTVHLSENKAFAPQTCVPHPPTHFPASDSIHNGYTEKIAFSTDFNKGFPSRQKAHSFAPAKGIFN